jgi:hypothetical protein
MAATPDPSSNPWPHWLLRYVAANNEQAFWDVVWSVGGSPPWGGITYEEAAAVYQLLELYRGPSMAPESAYTAVAEYLGGRPRDVLALEAFRIHDRIASRPEAITTADVEAGLQLAHELEHPALACYFALLLAQVTHESQNVGAAKDVLFEVLPALVALCMTDDVYFEQLLKAAQNAASFAVMDGDVEHARVAAQILRELGAEDRLGELGNYLL